MAPLPDFGGLVPPDSVLRSGAALKHRNARRLRRREEVDTPPLEGCCIAPVPALNSNLLTGVLFFCISPRGFPICLAQTFTCGPYRVVFLFS